ncbi:PadR family transcriptional regulator [Turicibacter sanguinis]|uniref:PadR family transcriptional regulator n=2 Tax=Turicibacter sanguinis TaxID=154288 RepID=A0A9X4XJP8_9FIRM|nr:PadR family transcriptional regulator [Turicibacter sanguinis]EFF63196.1 transcriptional regulator, PadR family [Turicibacter sanguinis PC909]MTK22312.1 PadR family transcriptional regulator [Turicibacter sanguinis]MTK73580.1 PadR family transcriptional regulator [Turicibacter sanguinis]
MNSQYKKGILELCVLSLIEQEDLYGYEIVQRISPRIEVTESTIYPLLRRLTKEGYCRTYMRDSSEGPARKYYVITTVGKKHLSKMVGDWKVFSLEINYFLEGVNVDESQNELD